MKTNIIVGITAGISAYKTVELVRLLRTASYAVKVVMTKDAMQFITPLTLQAISDHPVYTELFTNEAVSSAMPHIELARWADALVIAPATADFIAKCAQGLANDLLSTLCLAADKPLLMAPAMNEKMWHHPATQNNLVLLQQRGVEMIGPASGEQACGDIGLGRMVEPDVIVSHCEAFFMQRCLQGKHVVITAGPTQEAIDPVRYLSNRSSGKMGYALARVAKCMGASVTLISGPTTLLTPAVDKKISVRTALEMEEAVLFSMPCDIFMGCAAVADYRIANPSSQKIKKSDQEIAITLTRNPDIIARVSALKNRPFVVGFAAETQNLKASAKEKLEQKKLDMIVANQVGEDVGFDQDAQSVILLGDGYEETLPYASKFDLARSILQRMVRSQAQAKMASTLSR